MANRIATVSGTALVPGVSLNNRLYTPELIAGAVARAQERIAAGQAPLTMLTHHQAGDDSTRIVGSLTSMTLAEDGSARFTAELADTAHARTIARLVSGSKPHLKGVSIRGAWLGNVRRERGPDGVAVETADGLELDGLDFTRTPGVTGASIDDVAGGGGASETADGRHLIYESAEATLVTITEQVTAPDPQAGAQAKPEAAAEGPYADLGYRPDRKKRYPLRTVREAKTAWAFMNRPAGAKPYTVPQQKRIKNRIRMALEKHGVAVTAESWLVDTVAQEAPAAPDGDLAEDYSGMYGDDQAGTFCLNATNGSVSVTVSSYCVDPADLELILHAAVDGAAKALKAIDPDMDGDMDVAGAPAEDTDHDMGGPDSLAARIAKALGTETAGRPAEEVTEQATEQATQDAQVVAEEQEPAAEVEPAPTDPQNTAPEPAAANQEDEEPAMGDTTTAAEPTTGTAAAPTTSAAPAAITMTGDQFSALLAAVRSPAPVEAAPAAGTVAEATETQEQMVARMVAEGVAKAVEAAQPATQPAETQEQMIARMIAEGVQKALPGAIAESVERHGPPTRKGLVAPVDEKRTTAADGAGEVGVNAYGVPADWPDKPLHKYTPTEREKYFGAAVEQYVLGARSSR